MTSFLPGCFICFIVAVHASDDQSLMQHGVGIEHAAATSTRQTMETISSLVKQIQFPGKMRQMAIDALVRSVSQEADSIPSASLPRVHQIIDLLWNILQSMKDEKAADDDRLLAWLDNFDLCSERYREALDNATRKTNNSGNNASICLETEANLIFEPNGLHSNCSSLTQVLGSQATLDHCVAVRDWIQSNHSRYEWEYHAVHYPWTIDGESNSDKLGIWNWDWDKRLGDAATALDASWVSSIENNVESCAKAHDEVTGQESDCNSKMEKFRRNFCHEFGTLTSACNDLGSCHTEKTNEWEDEVALEVGKGNIRVKNADIIDRIICFLRQLESNTSFNTTKCDTSANATNADVYNVTVPPTPAQAVCDAVGDEVLLWEKAVEVHVEGALQKWTTHEYVRYTDSFDSTSWSCNALNR